MIHITFFEIWAGGGGVKPNVKYINCCQDQKSDRSAYTILIKAHFWLYHGHLGLSWGHFTYCHYCCSHLLSNESKRIRKSTIKLYGDHEWNADMSKQWVVDKWVITMIGIGDCVSLSCQKKAVSRKIIEFAVLKLMNTK